MNDKATILFGQFVDYNQIIKSGKDIQSVHHMVVNTFIEKYEGNLQFTSDNQLKISFTRPENAIQFALNITNRFHQEPRIPHKIGIAFTENSTHDYNASDIACFLSEVCPDNAILVSNEIVITLKRESNYSFKRVGSSLFKGLGKPVEIFALSESNLYVPAQNELTLKIKNENSIAVLPFHNTSSEKELDYICDGLAEEVIDSLTKSKNLFVTARSSSFLFRNKEVSILDISRKLNVSFVLDGSIRKRNDNYRISYQLVDCSTGYNIISDTLEASFDNLYDTEREISRSIIQYLDADNLTKIIKKDDFYIDPTAYSYYLQGKHLNTNWEFENVKQAIKFFDKALEIVPNYALAFAGLSITYAHLAIFKFADFKESMLKAIVYADKSIEADNTIPDGFLSKAISTSLMGNWYVPDLEKNITSALAISPCNAEIRMYNGLLFLIKGELKRSLSEIQLAKQLDPYSQSINIRLGLAQYLNREYEDAFNTYLYLLEVHQNKTYIISRIAWCCIQLKQYHKALEYLNESDYNYEYDNMIYSTYLVIYKALKNETKFFEYKELIEQLPKDETGTYYNIAVLNKLLGKKEQSIEYLSKTLQNPMFLFTFMQHNEFWEDFHNHPQFQELVTSKYKGTGNQLIKIDSETKEYIELKLSDFLYAEAQDNYTLIVYKEKNKKNEKILRATISHIEKQLKYQEIVRCHRSYLINLSSGFKFHKSDNKAHLKLPDWDIVIPVSRSKEQELKELIKSR